MMRDFLSVRFPGPGPGVHEIGRDYFVFTAVELCILAVALLTTVIASLMCRPGRRNLWGSACLVADAALLLAYSLVSVWLSLPGLYGTSSMIYVLACVLFIFQAVAMQEATAWMNGRRHSSAEGAIAMTVAASTLALRFSLMAVILWHPNGIPFFLVAVLKLLSLATLQREFDARQQTRVREPLMERHDMESWRNSLPVAMGLLCAAVRSCSDTWDMGKQFADAVFSWRNEHMMLIGTSVYSILVVSRTLLSCGDRCVSKNSSTVMSARDAGFASLVLSTSVVVTSVSSLCTDSKKCVFINDRSFRLATINKSLLVVTKMLLTAGFPYTD